MTLLTPQNAAVVTDSTADPNDRWPALGITVVPLKVVFKDEILDDGTQITQPQFYARLKQTVDLPTSSQPSVEDFAAVYQELSARVDHIFSIHISHIMSGTLQSATAAAQSFPKVEVVDSRNVSAGLGLMVERVWAKIREGVEEEALRDYMARFQERGRMLILPGTLEYLRRGGRIGRAQEMVGGVLNIRPLIQTLDGTLAPYVKARGERKAFEAISQYISEYAAAHETIYIGLEHAYYAEAIDLLRKAVLAARPDAQIVFTGWAGAVVGVHIGPGACAVAMMAE